MQIHFDGKHDEAKSLKELSISKLRFSLRRLAQQVSHARIRFTDVNGPRGGVDKHAHIQIHLQERGSIIVGATASDWRSALDEALRRGMAKLVKTFKQTRRSKRQSVKTLALNYDSN